MMISFKGRAEAKNARIREERERENWKKETKQELCKEKGDEKK